MDDVPREPPAPPALGATDLRRLILLSLAVLVANLPLLSRLEVSAEEGRRLLPAQSMLAGEGWVEPRIHGRSYLAKPPLFYWCVAATAVGLEAVGIDGGATLGRRALAPLPGVVAEPLLADLDDPPLPRLAPVPPLAARVPALLASVAVGAAVYLIVRRRVAPTAATLAAGCSVGATSLLAKSTLGEIETVLVATSFAGSAVAFYGLRGRASASLAGGLLIGAAVLAKGPIAYYFALLPIVVHGFLERRVHPQSARRAALTTAVALAVPGLWLALLLAGRADSTDVGATWAAELARRDENATVWDYPIDRVKFLVGVLLGWLPASWILLADRRSWRQTDLGRFAMLAIVLGLALLLVWPGVRVRYALPLLPWAAVIAGLSFERSPGARLAARRFATAVGALLAIGVAALGPVALYQSLPGGSVVDRHGLVGLLLAAVFGGGALALIGGRKLIAARRTGAPATALTGLVLLALGGRLVERVAIEAPKLHDRQRALGAAVLHAAAGDPSPTVVVGRWSQFNLLYYTGWRCRWGGGPDDVAPGQLWLVGADAAPPLPAADWELLGAPAGSLAAAGLDLEPGTYWARGAVLGAGWGGKDLRALALWRRLPEP